MNPIVYMTIAGRSLPQATSGPREALQKALLDLEDQEYQILSSADPLTTTVVPDRISLTVLQAVVRYKHRLEDPEGTTKLQFDFNAENTRVSVRIDGRLCLEGTLWPGYPNQTMRALAYVDDLKHGDGSFIPVTHQSHVLAALYHHPLIVGKV